MTNEIKTHRLIVTLPNTSGEEADTLASDIEWAIAYEPGVTYVRDATVTHALGESLPESVTARIEGDVVVVNFDTLAENTIPRHFTALEARQLAGVLLAHAEDIENEEANHG